MKKTISINISGILFHIEEDAYSQLKRYLENIQRHFSSYPDGSTVIQDIETRIAEIFLSKLKNNKQVITAEDVRLLIEKMGNIADFQSVERLHETEDLGLGADSEKEAPKNAEDYRYVTPDPKDQKGYKKLSRLHHGKVIAGVCAGIAHYVKMDPLWVRLIAILLLFSGRITFLNVDSFTGWGWPNVHVYFGNFGLLAYIILWVLLPVSYELPEDKTIKKLYRDPDDKVIGGVAGGLAAYFQLDVMIVRVGFLLLAFVGGTGVVLYLILWIITPSAASITDRIRMKGEAVTLTKIDDTLKQNLGAQPAQQQPSSPLLQPFRWLGRGLQALGQALGPLGLVLVLILRIFLGLVLMLVGIALIFASFALIISYFGLQGPWSEGVLYDWPIREINDMLNPISHQPDASGLYSGPGHLPSGGERPDPKKHHKWQAGLMLFGLWLLSVLLSGLNIGFIAKDYRQQATVEETFRYTAEAVPSLSVSGGRKARTGLRPKGPRHPQPPPPTRNYRARAATGEALFWPGSGACAAGRKSPSLRPPAGR
ncbi:PspC domain-containing protein [Nitritalea halalkaliphila]|uniref:PspC domain-containing protein n=1 Tax=Nitritalea halalkaliphila TaxID=590849 RepID=UPI00031B222B|nr:PspC domain-containing protein [Nitritalea halalkaliphila]